MAENKGHEAGSGIRSTRFTSVFRAVNFELFAKPVSVQRQAIGKAFISLAACGT